jgi:hypothetical protein
MNTEIVPVITEDREISTSEIRTILQNPRALKLILLEQLNRVEELEERIKRFLSADGYADTAQAAAVAELEYQAPDGKTKIMGRTYFVRVLERDGVIIRTADGGFRLSSDWVREKCGTTRQVERQGRMRSVALFTPKGVYRIARKYEHDKRRWFSTSSQELLLKQEDHSA